jgi:hypothetical protein
MTKRIRKNKHTHHITQIKIPSQNRRKKNNNKNKNKKPLQRTDQIVRRLLPQSANDASVEQILVAFLLHRLAALRIVPDKITRDFLAREITESGKTSNTQFRQKRKTDYRHKFQQQFESSTTRLSNQIKYLDIPTNLKRIFIWFLRSSHHQAILRLTD